MADFAEIIENIEQMPLESQEILIDIINKRFSEKKREHFITETLQSNEEYSKGEFYKGDSDELFKAIKI